ncbi:MAG: DUF3552 domain-containing protein [bacterium]|nr:DUF3552 domain-containing protein [bacterium]
MNIILVIVIGVGALLLGAVIGFFVYKKTLTEKALKFKARMAKARELEEEILEQARKKADEIKSQAERKADKIEEHRMKKIDDIQNRLLIREEKMDQKLEKVDEERQKITEKKKEADKIIEQQIKKLEELAKLSEQEAKDALFASLEEKYQSDIKKFIDKYKTIQQEEAEKEAQHIITQAIPRVASDSTSEFSTNLVDLPTEEFKGKLIGREGRNISYFEKMTGVELVIDDTPMVVRLSSFDAEKRFIATETLKSLIKDGRINPFYIEKTYNEMVDGLDDILMEKGKEALNILNLPMMKPEVVRTIGQFYLRSSYGQNLWIHSIEVAKISEAIASELGLDQVLAKKAGLLHDVGKVIATTGQSHTKLGADFLRKQGINKDIVNAAESHHYDVPMTSPISWIVAAADAMSASRP